MPSVGLVANCAHGFPAGECLICRTLGDGAPAGAAEGGRPGRRAAKVATKAPADINLALSQRSGRLPVGAPAPAAPVRSGHGHFFTVLAALVVGGVVVWAFAGVVSLAFHIAEYVALAAAAGWAGYRLGYARGRHHRR
jgi:hypothetical protein